MERGLLEFISSQLPRALFLREGYGYGITLIGISPFRKCCSNYNKMLNKENIFLFNHQARCLIYKAC